MPHGNTRRSIIGGDIICFVLLLFCVCYFVLMFSLFSFPLAHTSHRKHRPHVLWAEMQILSSSLGTTPTACRPVAWSVTCKISLASGHGTKRSVGQGLGSQENEERGGCTCFAAESLLGHCCHLQKVVLHSLLSFHEWVYLLLIFLIMSMCEYIPVKTKI